MRDLPTGRIDYLICRREADAPDGVLYAAGDFAGQRTADGGWVIVPEVTLMRAEAATYAGAHAARLLADAFNALSPGPEGREPWVALPAVVHLPLPYRGRERSLEERQARAKAELIATAHLPANAIMRKIAIDKAGQCGIEVEE